MLRSAPLAPTLLLLLTLAACARNDGTDTAAQPWAGDYRAALQLPGGELPFALSITEEQGRLVGWIANGDERLRIDETTASGDELTLRMPGYENRITARQRGGQLQGELFMVKAKGEHQRIPFTALRGAPPRFFPQAADPGGDVSGRWATTFTDDEGDSYVAVGEFEQSGSDVTGTFLTPTGDYRYLSGELRSGQLFLSTFNGGHVFLFRAQLSGDGTALDGEFWSGLASHERFSAHRDDNASLGDTTQVTAVRNAGERFSFTFPDLDGRPVSLSDPAFAGKVVVVALAGSWCPNCHDEVAFLKAMRDRYRGEGLEIIGLMFEQLESATEARAAVARFRDRWSIPYPLLLAGSSPTEDATTRLPQLNGVYAYPTTIFVDRNGLVRHIHTGFSGPATGGHYTALTRDFEDRIRALLAESS